MKSWLKLILISLFLVSGCEVIAKNQDDSKPVKIKSLTRGKDGIYRVPRSKKQQKEEEAERVLAAKAAADLARQQALQAKADYESRKKIKISEPVKGSFSNWSYTCLYYFTFLAGLGVYIFNKGKKK